MRPSAPIALLFLVLIPLSALSQNPSATPPNHQQFLQKLVAAAIDRTQHIVRYDPAYVRIPYPNGDVPPDTGVCTDEIIRAYRAVGIDLQKEVHEGHGAQFLGVSKSTALASCPYGHKH